MQQTEPAPPKRQRLAKPEPSPQDLIALFGWELVFAWLPIEKFAQCAQVCGFWRGRRELVSSWPKYHTLRMYETNFTLFDISPMFTNGHRLIKYEKIPMVAISFSVDAQPQIPKEKLESGVLVFLRRIFAQHAPTKHTQITEDIQERAGSRGRRVIRKESIADVRPCKFEMVTRFENREAFTQWFVRSEAELLPAAKRFAHCIHAEDSESSDEDSSDEY